MKQLFLSALIMCYALSVNADQAAYLTKKQADAAVAYITSTGINKMLLWCGCCDNDKMRGIHLDKMYARYTGDEDYYELVIKGRGKDGLIEETIDLAYVWVQAGKMAKNLGVLLNMDVTPCSAPFDFPR